MKKALSLILALVLTFSVFAGVTVFAYNTNPTSIPFRMSGYKYNAPASDVKIWLDNELSVISDMAVDMRYHIEDADGVVEEGNIRALVNYKLVCELILAEDVTTDRLQMDRIRVYQEEPYRYITASDFHFEGDWFVIEFDLPLLAEVIEAIDFYIEGYEVGTPVEDIVVYSDNELVTNCRVSFYMSKDSNSALVRENGKIKANIYYTVSVLYDIPVGYTVPYNWKIELHLPDGKAYNSKNTVVTEDYYSSSFQIPKIKSSDKTIMGVKFLMSGYQYGKKADDMTVSADAEGIIVSSVSVKTPVGVPADGNYEEFHGYFDAYKDYRIFIYAEVAEGYKLYDDLPNNWILINTGNSSSNHYMTYYPYGDGFVFEATVPRLANPNLSPKRAAGFSIHGYELGADVAGVSVTVADEEIEIIDVSIINSSGEYCTGAISEGIEYQVVFTAFAPGGWYVSPQTAPDFTLEGGKLGAVTPASLIDERIVSFKYTLTVFGEPIDPGDPGEPGDYEKISSLEMCLTGYELGNEAKDIGVTCENDAAVIRKVTVKTPEGEDYDGIIEAGRRYQVIVTVFARGGWSFSGEYGTLNVVKLDGVSCFDLGMETVHDTISFLYYVYPLAAHDNVDAISDMDGDGKTTVSDALRTLRIAAKLDVAVMPKSTRSAILGDADRDGEITVSDALIVLRKAAKLA